ncbi:hypothetical protein [Streptomyces sp. Inha503]|uniref:hypothetical protein n=1 Tax=Streptomyces sp. Inha503 TaxID=3383314 RepID=UPI0039A38DD6
MIATDLMLGAGLVNDAEALCRAVAREFGDEAVVVRHFPAWSMLARDNDVFHVLRLDEKDTARFQLCTAAGCRGPAGSTRPAARRPARR